MVVNHCYLGRGNDKVLKFYMNDFSHFTFLSFLPPISITLKMSKLNESEMLRENMVKLKVQSTFHK